MNKTIAHYGSWKSPISADLITAGAVSPVELIVDGKDFYWIESRPKENGRYVIMRYAENGTITECTPAGFNARTSVHEYGGGAFTVSDGIIYFVNYKDQRIYRHAPGQTPAMLTPGEGHRYADLIVDKKRNRLICIREDHTGEGEAINTIVSVDLNGNDNGVMLVSGNNFYSSARLSPDGTKLAYLTWSHPNMPWDGCELWLADVHEDGSLHHADLVAGSASECIFQPEWSPGGVLHFVAEPNGWWNLYRLKDGKIEALHPMEAEFGEPQWVFNMTKYGFLSEKTIFCAYTKNGRWQPALLNLESKELSPIQTPLGEISDVHCGSGFVVFIGGSFDQPLSVIRYDSIKNSFETIKQAFEVTVDRGYLSIPQPISFPTTGDKTAHAIYYPPMNKDFTAPNGERPPLMVISHGGPTSQTLVVLQYKIQYWTSRGFAVVDVDYGGSTGYGREYRQRLNGNWGVVDVDDCCNAALYLVKEGLADPERLAIRGGSAGGFTTFACLAFRNVFKAGAGHFGVSELEIFVNDTHKFESRYLFTLVGPYPERKNLYYERSPINSAHQINCPLILFQGDEDKVVPPSQSQLMYEAVRGREIPTAYILFEGEQHGFRKADSIKRSLEGELYFYSKIFKFDLAEDIDPIEIDNI